VASTASHPWIARPVPLDPSCKSWKTWAMGAASCAACPPQQSCEA